MTITNNTLVLGTTFVSNNTSLLSTVAPNSTLSTVSNVSETTQLPVTFMANQIAGCSNLLQPLTDAGHSFAETFFIQLFSDCKSILLLMQQNITGYNPNVRVAGSTTSTTLHGNTSNAILATNIVTGNIIAQNQIAGTTGCYDMCGVGNIANYVQIAGQLLAVIPSTSVASPSVAISAPAPAVPLSISATYNSIPNYGPISNSCLLLQTNATEALSMFNQASNIMAATIEHAAQQANTSLSQLNFFMILYTSPSMPLNLFDPSSPIQFNQTDFNITNNDLYSALSYGCTTSTTLTTTSMLKMTEPATTPAELFIIPPVTATRPRSSTSGAISIFTSIQAATGFLHLVMYLMSVGNFTLQGALMASFLYLIFGQN